MAIYYLSAADVCIVYYNIYSFTMQAWLFIIYLQQMCVLYTYITYMTCIYRFSTHAHIKIYIVNILCTFSQATKCSINKK